MAVLYDPALDQYSITGEPTTSNTGAATRLPDGRVLVTGAALQAGSSHADLFDPSTGTFTSLPSDVNPNPNDATVTLADGRVLYFGQGGQPSWAFDPARSGFSTIPTQAMAAGGAATLLADGRVLIIDSHGTASVLDPGTLP
jgi:hypothetical protein